MKLPKILIVEDEAISGMALQCELMEAGFPEVELASDGLGALKLIDTFEPNLVILDINLPGQLTGLQIAEQIKSNSKSKIIFLTGYDDETLRSEAMNYSPLAYLVKPLTSDRIIEQIKEKYQK